MPSPLDAIHSAYVAVKDACDERHGSREAGEAIRRLSEISAQFLSEECTAVNLVSEVEGKQYVSFKRRRNSDILTRPANQQFYVQNPQVVRSYWRAWEQGQINQADFAKFSYTVALAPCLAMEMFDRQNRKGPATYFECLIGHMFSKELGIEPEKQASFQVLDRNVRLTMDFLFTGQAGLRIHLPVKMSTRERVVQAWAHQRILDGAFGENSFKGIMVIFSETKLDSRSHEVVEICVPDQWMVYQTLLSKIERIYYFDVPGRYQTLTNAYPDLIRIKNFGEFFTERASLFGRAR